MLICLKNLTRAAYHGRKWNLNIGQHSIKKRKNKISRDGNKNCEIFSYQKFFLIELIRLTSNEMNHVESLDGIANFFFSNFFNPQKNFFVIKKNSQNSLFSTFFLIFFQFFQL